MLKSKIVRTLAIIAVLLAGLWIYLSLTWEERVLKLVLQFDEIPPSLTVLDIQDNSWEGYVAHGHFTINPEDFPAILKGKKFTSTTWPPKHSTTRKDGRVMNHQYQASAPGHLLLLVDEKKEFVEFTYGAD